MIERFTKRGRELNRDIKDCGKVEPGSQFFQEVQKLEKERMEVINRVGGRVGVILIAVLAGASMLDDFYALRAIWGSKDPAPKPVPALSNRPTPQYIDPEPKVRRTEITDPVEVAKTARRFNLAEIMTNAVGVYITETAKVLKGNENFAELDPPARELIKFYNERAHGTQNVLSPELASGFVVMEMEKAGADYFDTPARVWLRDYQIPFYHREKRTLLYSKPAVATLTAASEYELLRLSFIWLALADARDDLAGGGKKSGLEDRIKLGSIVDSSQGFTRDLLRVISSSEKLDRAITATSLEELRNSLKSFKDADAAKITDPELLALVRNILDNLLEEAIHAQGVPASRDESYIDVALYRFFRMFLLIPELMLENSESMPILVRMHDLAGKVMEKPEMIRR